MTATRPVGYVTGLDGKTYRGTALSDDQREFIHGHAHWLRHDRGLTIRGIVDAFAVQGIRVSVGTVHHHLRQPCTACVQVGTSAAPEHADGGER